MSVQPPKPPPTTRERTQNFLLYGFAASILLHVLIGPLIKFQRSSDAPEKTQTVSIERMPTPPPTPKPTPKPTPTPPPTPPPKQTPEPPKPPQAIKIVTLKTKASTTGTEASNTHTVGNRESGAAVGTPTGAPSAPPATAAPTSAPPPPPPPPTPTPLACAVPNADPRTVSAAEAETPPLAQQQGITGEVSVRVTLDANSNLISAVIDQSPSPLLNNAALQAARQSKFQTKIVACKPVGDTYRFIVDFQSQ